MNGFALTAAGTVLAAILGGVFLIAAQRITSRANTRVEAEKLDLARFEAFEKRSDAAIERNDRRIADLEDALQHEKDQRRLSNQYARTLAQVLRDHDMPVPLPPEGLDLP